MYFPYLRGRQNELLCLRELLEVDRLYSTIIPIIEPVRCNSTFFIIKKTTVKEIRAHAFDYVTIATFKLIREINVLDLCSITHNSPFYADTDKVDYLINEQIMRAIERDLAKPMSRWDSELDYLPTQYISDFAKFCGYDGVRYYSTFDKDAYNIALFDSSACSCTYHRNFLVGDLEYKLSSV